MEGQGDDDDDKDKDDENELVDKQLLLRVRGILLVLLLTLPRTTVRQLSVLSASISDLH